MYKLGLPLPFQQLQSKPEIVGMINLTQDMQQSLSLMTAYDGIQRQLLKCTPTGTLYTASARVKGILNITGVGTNDDWQGDDIKTSEVLIKANPDNTGRVWINVDAAAGVDTGHPLDAGDFIQFTINNLHNLHLLIVVSGEKASIIYTR